MLLRREIFNAVGMFSAEYFMYAEDLDTVLHAGAQDTQITTVVAQSIVHYGRDEQRFRLANCRENKSGAPISVRSTMDMCMAWCFGWDLP